MVPAAFVPNCMTAWPALCTLSPTSCWRSLSSARPRPPVRTAPTASSPPSRPASVPHARHRRQPTWLRSEAGRRSVPIRGPLRNRAIDRPSSSANMRPRRKSRLARSVAAATAQPGASASSSGAIARANAPASGGCMLRAGNLRRYIAKRFLTMILGAFVVCARWSS